MVLLVLLALAILVLSVPPAPLDLAATETLALLALLALLDLLAHQASLVPTVRRRTPVVTLLQPCTVLTLVWGVLLLAEEQNALLVSFNRSIRRVLAPVDLTVTQAPVTLQCVLILPMDT